MSSYRNRIVSIILGLCCLAAVPVWAHHSFAAEYDGGKPVAMKGTVTKIEWVNPHVFISFDVKDGAEAVNWIFEGYPPNTLRRTGFAKGMLKPGDVITVTGWLSRDGSHRFAGREITWEDGKKIFVGPISN
jgi:cytochrome c-type biogenesis protein CcmE